MAARLSRAPPDGQISHIAPSLFHCRSDPDQHLLSAFNIVIPPALAH